VPFQVEVAHRILRLFTSQTTQGQCLSRHSKLFAGRREDDAILGGLDLAKAALFRRTSDWMEIASCDFVLLDASCRP
jgi:hypothetical protein